MARKRSNEVVTVELSFSEGQWATTIDKCLCFVRFDLQKIEIDDDDDDVEIIEETSKWG